LLDIETELYSGSAVAVTALIGTGGVGKTQIAAEYAYRHCGDYDLIAWINAERVELIPGQLAMLAEHLDVPSTDDMPETARAVLAGLGRTNLAWLLVFDNADQPGDLIEWLPQSGTGHVIVTSRQAGWDALGSGQDVDVFSRTEAVTLLRRRLPAVDDATAGEIVELLGYLPLAVEQVAAYLAEGTGIPAKEYAQMLRTQGEELLDQGDISGHEHTIAAVWRISQASLHIASPAAEQLLRLCAFLGPEPIPLDLFTSRPDQLPSLLADVAADRLRFNATAGALVARSLARRSSDGLSVHRLLAGVVRRPLLESERQAAIDADRELLFQYLPRDIAGSPENWPTWRVLLPHVLAATSHKSPHLPIRTAVLLDRAGTYLGAQGQPTAARPLLERALQIVRSVSPDDPIEAKALNNLALVLDELGQSAEALPLLERALRIDETSSGEDHPELASTLSNLASVLRSLGRPAEAVPLLERALQIGEASYGPDDPAIATMLSNLGLVLNAIGRSSESLPFLQRALHIGESNLGQDHPTVANLLNNLAAVLKGLGRFAEARPLFERALRIDEATYGSDHPKVAIALSNLALVLNEFARPEAETLLERALRIDEATYGPNHPAVGASLSNLATVLRDRGQPAEALPLLQRALRIDDATYGPSHPVIAPLLVNLAVVLTDLRRPAEALPLLERALQIDDAVYGPTHPSVAEDMENLGAVLRVLGRSAEAVSMFERARSIANDTSRN
jgi:tetratricopeptide (TPR) repeat protein